MGLFQDLQFAVRLLVKDKWFTLVATLALAFGIGVNATVFTFVNAVLIRGLPFPEPDRIMAVDSFDPVRNDTMGVSWLDYEEWAQARSLTGLAAGTGATMNLSDEGRPPERFGGAYVSGHLFRMLGEAPALGRDFTADDDRPGAAPVVILGSRIFKNRYGADPSVIGRTIRVNEVPAVVIAVMPDGFAFPGTTDLWQPIATMRGLREQPRSTRSLQLVGRLAPGYSLAQAQA
jgi:putative ABC transport system permease protein